MLFIDIFMIYDNLRAYIFSRGTYCAHGVYIFTRGAYILVAVLIARTARLYF